MDAIEILVADSLADSLSRMSFTGTITSVDAERVYVPDFTLEDMSSLRVSVVPGSCAVTNLTHGADLFEIEIHVVIGKKLEATSDLDDLVNLRTQIVDAIRSKTLPSSVPAMPAGVSWYSIDNAVTYDRDQVTGHRTFLADITVVYRRSQAKVSL